MDKIDNSPNWPLLKLILSSLIVVNFYLGIDSTYKQDFSLLINILNLSLIPMFVFIASYTTKSIDWKSWRLHFISSVIIYVTFQTIDAIPLYAKGELDWYVYLFYPQNGVWFFLAIPIWQAIFLFLPSSIKNNYIYLFFILIGILIFSSWLKEVFSITSGFIGIIDYFPFFIIAYFFNGKKVLGLRQRHVFPISLGVIAIIISIYFKPYLQKIILDNAILNTDYFKNILSFVMSVILGVGIVYFSLSTKKIDNIAKNALGIYLIHPIICFILLRMLSKLNVETNILIVIGLSLLTITISLLLAKNKFIHWFLDPVLRSGMDR